MARDEGASLIEVLLATAILGIAVVVLVSGLTTAVFSSEQHREQASAGAYLRAVAEFIKSQPYAPCASTATYSTLGAVPAGAPFSAQVTAIAHYTATGSSLAPLPACTAATDDLQLVAVRVVASDGRADESVTFPMRRP